MIIDFININVVEHCNNSCKYCNNSSPYFKEEIEYDGKIYNKYLKILKDKNINFKYIHLVGGEPFLHSNLLNFILDIKKDLDIKIKLWTNGILLKNKEFNYYEYIYNNIDILAISIYPNIFKDLLNDDFLINFKEYINNNFNNLRLDLVNRSKMSYMGISKNKINNDLIECHSFDCFILKYDKKLFRCPFVANSYIRSDINNVFLNENNYINIDDKKENIINYLNNRDIIEICCNYCILNLIREDINYR
jgi:organic radical activating enzyme